MPFKRACLAAILTIGAYPASAELLFSEYIEGSGSNKALEIYNNGADPVDLAGYQLRIYFNGSSSVGTVIDLFGTLASGDVYVVADDGADSAILAQADLAPINNFFNGDDAIELFDGVAVIDSIGQVGFDPGSQWGSGDISTQNNTLRRKPEIVSGDADSSDAFDPALEWDGFANDSFAGLGSVGDAGPPPPPALALVHDIQGNGAASPLAGQRVTVEAIVVGDFQENGAADNGDLGGFFVQEEDADADADGATSEGIFVDDGDGLLDVAVGDRVRVIGTVREIFGLTGIVAESVATQAVAQPLPAAALLTLPVASIDAFEPYEGMRVRFPQALVISEYFNFDRFGEIVLARPLDGETRPMTPTAMALPGSDEYLARADLNRRSRITLDDGRTSQNPDPARHPNGAVFDLSNRFRGGDRVQDAAGVLNYSFGLYRIQPTVGANYIPANPRPELPPEIDATLRVASFNVLNYFTTLDQDGNFCGPNPLEDPLGCRGADNADEFMRQRDKIIAALARIDADIVGLIEIENNAAAAVDDLVAGLNAVAGPGAYAKIDTGTIGIDAIKVALIYRPARVVPLGGYAILDAAVDADFNDDKNRPALAQTFTSLANGGRVTVAVNHLKSKGSPCDDLGDPDLGDGQGNCNQIRTLAAMALVDWLDSDPTGAGDGDALIIGDLNAYDQEDPIAAIAGAGYVDLLARDQGEAAYSFVFDGQFGYLDYALANASAAPQVVAADVWHINADEPDIFDYDTSFKKDAQDALYEPNPFRSSDHDPVIVGLALDAALADIRAYVGQAAADGSLTGSGGGRHAARRLQYFGWLLALTERLENRQRRVAACALLGQARRLADGRPWPRDWVEGPAAGIVAGMIEVYRRTNCARAWR